MDVLPHAFRSCRLCGFWYEDSSKFLLKLLYSGFVSFVIVSFTLSLMIELVRNRNTLNEVAEVLFVGFNYTAVCLKVLNFTYRKNAMRRLLQDFRLPLYRSQSPEEETIVGRYDNFLAAMCLGYLIICNTGGCITMGLGPLLTGTPELPFRAYQPFNYTGEPVYFAVAYSLQFLALVYGITISVSLDAMACSFMILITEQIELNCHRILNASMPLKRCIEHQVLLLRTVTKIQEFFMPAVIPLFFCSMITFCTTILLISQIPVTSVDFLSVCLYLTAMMFQVFLYCWFGNELELKNQELSDAIYSSNWTNCKTEKRKHLWFIMLFTNHTTRISFHGQCRLTLNTFISIVKTSYGAFNLLSQVLN